MFDSLSDKLTKVFRNLRGYGKLSESNIKDALREIKLALLEADVNYKVVKSFIDAVKEKSVGEEVLKSVTPGQQIVKIVHDEMVSLMGNKAEALQLRAKGNRIMIVGLQGSGKTTTAAKLAVHFRKMGHKPHLAALDIQRPAAIDQLVFLGKQNNIPVTFDKNDKKVVSIAKKALEHVKNSDCTVSLFDTAGRLHIDDQLMAELEALKDVIQPHEILFVADAMTGQDAVNSVSQFNERLGISGVILTKLDGDARGGAALSIRATTGCPIRYVGLGEKVSDIELFHPDRMVSRILGMGDVVSLVEKAQAQMDEEHIKSFEEKLKKNEIDLEDFLKQIRQFRKLGPLKNIMEMIPGMNNMKGLDLDEKQFVHVEAIIQSMTLKERTHPHVIDFSRKRRIAAGSGTSMQEVNQLLKKFFIMKKMMKTVMKQKNKFTKMGGSLWR
ncbi:MAG: signal recognition particle protein [Candidatus Auribacter fodinae]|uniref:Signal recognition particle protein n=1 Tax=Candidatus Auribacter fodinae TaxID=2093366 RepID=A0A3A4QVB6_9BACT|nr:MAG: signal recognition particle protein [Candidatus Auribacter fodinae]